MRLSRVIYNLFESDAERLDSEPNAAFHLLDREIVLLCDDPKETYISWKQTVSNEDDVIFSMAHQATSFFVNEFIVRDMTTHPFWQPLIGQELTLCDDDRDHQILEIKAEHHSVYCSSYEEGHWGADFVHVSLVAPKMN
jgi:hypothetical protein